MDQPLVSVLMTSYNAESFIAKAIQSVLAQTHRNWELLILDDVSTDGTRVVIDSFNDTRIKKIYNTQNIGYVASKNVLLKEFTGAYACFLDADDWMAPNRIEAQLAMLIKDPEVGACMCSYIRVQPDDTEVPMNFFASSKFLDIKKGDVHFAGAGIMCSKKAIDEVGGFEMYFDKLMGDDTYWALKIAERFKFYYLHLPLYYYRANAQSITASFNNLRKFTILELLDEVKRQRLTKGTDWLEEKKFEKAKAYEESFLKNKKWLAEKYRQAAAVRLDFSDIETAGELLKKAFTYHSFSFSLYRTLAYYFKEKLSTPSASNTSVWPTKCKS
jgi:glycosyltransferase involved in cell wall biosynthesis